jgi:hypothetical protein
VLAAKCRKLAVRTELFRADLASKSFAMTVSGLENITAPVAAIL